MWRLKLEQFKLEMRCRFLAGRVITCWNSLSGELVDLALREALKMRLVIFLQDTLSSSSLVCCCMHMCRDQPRWIQ